MNLSDTIQSLGKSVIDTAATVYVAKNTKSAPTDTPRVPTAPAGLPPDKPTTGVPPVTGSASGVPDWVWGVGVAVLAAGAVFFLTRK